MKVQIVELTTESITKSDLDMLAVSAGSKKGSALFDKASRSRYCKDMPLSIKDDFTGKREKTALFYPIDSAIQRILLVGLGKYSERKKTNAAKEVYRKCGGIMATAAKKHRVKSLGIAIPAITKVKPEEFVEHCIEGLLLGLYSFRKYKSLKENDDSNYTFPKVITFFAPSEVCNISNLQYALDCGERAASAANIARDMANEPGNGWRPENFAEFGRGLAARNNVRCKVIEKEEMQQLGMGGILGVNQGSEEAPKLVIVDYCPEKYSETVMLVGKGLTFDSGGVSLKPASGMQDMKYDMCGGAAVCAAMEVITAEQPNVRVVALVPSTDNMAGGGALKPGDIISHYGGITSEIVNTDAEGRLILADALAYGIEQFSPDCVVDLATLTGAVIIGLGHHFVGVLSNNDKLCNTMMKTAKRAGEPQWRLPLHPTYAKQIESTVADIKNSVGRPAGTITAAEYLHKFVGDTPWIHLDIAGTAWNYSERSYVAKNSPSGVGTRTLIQFIREKQ